MDRGTDALKSHLAGAQKIDVRQTRRGWLQECCGCEARTEFKFFNSDGTQVAHALEESNFCCRCWCSPCHNFKMEVKELNTDAEMLTIDRPFACPVGSCKCCCYQSAAFTSGGNPMGGIKENCYWCVPSFTLTDGKGDPVYKMHQPTCCCGCCVNCCAEGNPVRYNYCYTRSYDKTVNRAYNSVVSHFILYHVLSAVEGAAARSPSISFRLIRKRLAATHPMRERSSSK